MIRQSLLKNIYYLIKKKGSIVSLKMINYKIYKIIKVLKLNIYLIL